MQKGERLAWMVVLSLCTFAYYAHTWTRAVSSPNALYQEDETYEDLGEEKDMGKPTQDIVFLRDLPDSDPLVKGKMSVENFRFAHIPKTGGTFIEEMFKYKLRTKVGRHDKNQYALIARGGDEPIMAKLRRHHCSFWHMPTSTFAFHANKTKHQWGQDFLNRPSFTVVRHPLSRLLSEYNFMLAHEWGHRLIKRFTTDNVVDPEEFCNPKIFNEVVSNMLKYIFDEGHSYFRDCHYVPQVRHLTDSRGRQLVKYVMMQEHLTEEMQTFLGYFGYTTNATEIKSYGGNHPPGPCKVSASDLTRKTMLKVLDCYKEDFDRLGYERPLVPPPPRDAKTKPVPDTRSS